MRISRILVCRLADGGVGAESSKCTGLCFRTDEPVEGGDRN